MSSQGWGHDELAADLAAHLNNGKRMIWLDMQLGPAGSARPDVYTLEKSFQSPLPTAYEIKVSKSDFRSDVTSGKWQKYLEFARGVYFCVPSGLVAKAEIPPGAGLMVRTDKVWRAVKKPTLSTTALPQKAMLKLLIDGIEREYRTNQADRYARVVRFKDIKKQLGSDVATAVKSIQDAREVLRTIQDEIDYKFKRERRKIEGITRKATSEAHYIKENESKVWNSLCDLAGLPHGTGGYELQAAISNLRKQLQVEPALASARSSLENLQRQLTYAIKELEI